MKNSIFNLLTIAASTIVLSACYSPKFMVDDDVYVLKPNEVPIGESLNDETSYSNFRNNRRNGVSSSYDNDYFIANNSFNSPFFGNSMFGMSNNWGWYRPGFSIFYLPNMGFSYDPWGNYYGYHNPYYYGYYNPYYSYFDPFFNPYYNGWGNNWNNGSNFWGNGGGSTTVAYNHTNGPRGSITGGFGNPNRLESGVKIKSNTLGSNGVKTPVRVSNSDIVGRNISSTTVTTVNRPINNSGTTTFSRNNGSTSTGVSRTNVRTLEPVENRGITTINSSSGAGRGSSGTISNGSAGSGGRSSGISNSGSEGSRSTTINESRSGSSMGSSGSSGSSSGRSSGGSSSSGGSTGRRP